MNRIHIVCIAAGALLSGCTQHHLVMADKAFDRMAYADAACRYEKALSHSSDRAFALRAAESYGHLNNAAKAADWYAYADRVEPLSGDDAMKYGRALLTLKRTGEAAKQLERVLADRPEDPIVRELGMAIADRDAFFVDTTLYSISPVNIDGVLSAFCAVPFGEGILFAAEKKAQAGRDNPWNGASFLDLYTAGGGSHVTAAPLPGDVNGRFHDGPATLSPDGKTMYFTRSDYYRFRLNKDDKSTSHLMLYRAEQQSDGSWGNVSSFAYNGYDFSAGHAALSSDGSRLYYVSDMPGGIGGTDIYVCERTSEGWGLPRNLGPKVNTAANEMFPVMRNDTMYFASNGHRSLGGLDIFRTTLSEGEWTQPENLNYPVNTTYDDFGFILLPDGRSGYLSSNRRGLDGIFKFSINDPTLMLHATFLDEEDGTPMAGVEVKMLEPTMPEPIRLFTDDDGSITLPLTVDKLYEVMASKDGIFTESRTVSTHDQRWSKTYEEEFRMKRVVVDKPIVIENIYYDYDRWDIRPDAAIELDHIAKLFIANPNLSFELGSHTDSRASDTYNLLLSDARAKSAMDYLVRKGVPSERLTARGYGERDLVNHCKDGVDCSEEEHQANRRTEFKVTRILNDVTEQR